MCKISWSPYDTQDELDTGHASRAQPRLVWAVPVSVVHLGASIEAHADTLIEVTTFRLCHRFGRPERALSRLAEETVEQIIDEVRLAAQAVTEPVWSDLYNCFQNFCAFKDHYKIKKVIDETWPEYLASLEDSLCPDHLASLTNLPLPKKAKLIQEYMDNDKSMIFFGGSGFLAHDDAQNDFITRTCMCRDRPPEIVSRWNQRQKTFFRFSELLKKEFGLEAIILHDAQNPNMYKFLLEYDISGSSAGYHTWCYLAIASGVDDTRFGHTFDVDTLKSSWQQVKARHPQFRNCGDHSSFRSAVDLKSLSITQKQITRFKKAMRVLNLKPHFHTGELERLIEHPIQDPALANICGCKQRCPHNSDEPECPGIPMDRASRVEKVKEFLAEKNKEYQKESWPQLMMLAASDATSPCGVYDY